MGGGAGQTSQTFGEDAESSGPWSTIENEENYEESQAPSALETNEGSQQLEKGVVEQLEGGNVELGGGENVAQARGGFFEQLVERTVVHSDGDGLEFLPDGVSLVVDSAGDQGFLNEAVSEDGGEFEPEMPPPEAVKPVQVKKLPGWFLPSVIACLVVLTPVAVSFAVPATTPKGSTVVMVPPFDKAAYTIANYATVLAEVYEGDSLPPAPMIAKQRTLLEEASINVRTLTFEDRDNLADKLEASAVVAQQASDDLVEMYVSALTGVQLVESYMVILNRRLSNNHTAGNETWLAAEFETFVKGADDCLVDSLEKADRAYTSLAEFQGQMSLASRIGKQVSAPLKRDLMIIQKEQEAAWWRWEKTSDLFLADESSALENVLSKLFEFQHQLGQIRVVLKGHREHLHTIRNAFFYSARDSVPMESQQMTLTWALETVKDSQTTIQENKRRKLTGN